MKKKVLWILLCFFIGMISTTAKEYDFYFYPNGGKVKTSGFELGDYGYLSYNGNFYANYNEKSTIKKINSIKGVSFQLEKSGTSLVSGKEWYTIVDGKTYFFNQSKTYSMKTVLKTLKLENEDFYSFDLYANWNDKKRTNGIDISSGKDSTTSSSKNTKKATSMTISSSNEKIKVGESTTLKASFKPSGATSETVTWTSSNTKIATISSSGKVTGVSAGTVTITAKSKNGLKATKKIVITKKQATTHHVIIKYHMNGGKLSSKKGKNISSNGQLINSNNAVLVQKCKYNGSIGHSGLFDYNNPSIINIVKNGYMPTKGMEWNTKPDGTGKSYNQEKNYKASDFCNATNSDCTVTLYVNWKEQVDVALLWGQSNMNGWAGTSQDYVAHTIDQRPQKSELYDASNNPYDNDILANYVNITKVNYTIPANKAWEYKYTTNRLADLNNNGNNMPSFGEEIAANSERSLYRSIGTNMVPYFAKAYIGETGHKLIIVHATSPGKKVECFLPVNDKDYFCGNKKLYIYENLKAKYLAAVKLIKQQGYTINNSFYVVMQGEANYFMDSHGPKTYYKHYMKVHNNMKKDLGIQFGAIIYTASKIERRRDKSLCSTVDQLHAEQVKLVSKNKDIMLGTDWGYKRYTEEYENAFGLKKHTVTLNGKNVEVKDNSIHFTSASLSKIGVNAAINVSKRIKYPNMNTSYVGYTKNCK